MPLLQRVLAATKRPVNQEMIVTAVLVLGLLLAIALLSTKELVNLTLGNALKISGIARLTQTAAATDRPVMLTMQLVYTTVAQELVLEHLI